MNKTMTELENGIVNNILDRELLRTTTDAVSIEPLFEKAIENKKWDMIVPLISMFIIDQKHPDNNIRLERCLYRLVKELKRTNQC